MGIKTNKPMNGWLALSPLIIFLCVYLISSIIAQDFYKIPISSAFLIASIYAVLITRGRSLQERVSAFSDGAGNRNVTRNHVCFWQIMASSKIEYIPKRAFNPFFHK